LPQRIEAVARAAECLDEPRSELDIVQHHIILQRAVAEQHVEQLRGIFTDGLLPQRDADLEQAFFYFGDRLDLSDDFCAHEWVVNRRNGHLDALLDSKRTGARFNRVRIAADTIESFQPSLHHHSLTGAPPSTSAMRARVAAEVSLGSASSGK